jgi:hypothetical protein
MGEPDTWVPVNEACARLSVSRSTFYELLRNELTGLGAIVRRIPPGTGRLRVPLRQLEQLVARWKR